MKFIFFYILVLIGFSTSVFAQSDSELENRIKIIRQIYQTVNDNVKKDIFLIDKIEINSSKKPEFPAVGVYDKTIEAHYTVGTEENAYQKLFRRIFILHHYSTYTTSTEYIFDENSELIFIFYTNGEGQSYRFYFDKIVKKEEQKIIRLIIDKTSKDNPILDSKTNEILQNLKEEKENILLILQKL